MFIYVKINKILFINIPIEKILEEILVLFSDEDNTRKSASQRINPRGFPYVFPSENNTRISRGFFQ